MAFDFKKEYKQLYQPGTKPEIVQVPPMNFVAVRGQATQMRKTAPTRTPSQSSTPSPIR